MQPLRMVHLLTVQSAFQARVIAARLGSEGVTAQLRGAVDGPYPIGDTLVFVTEDDLPTASELLLADEVEAAFHTAQRAPTRRPVRAAYVVALVLVMVSIAAARARASNDPDFGRQYGVTQVQAPSAWAKTRAAGITIAVIDSGVDLDHPDLAPKLVKGYDFGDDDANPDDDSELKDAAGRKVKGHGTHVAGIAGAATDNGIGGAGVAPEAKIMPLKVFGSGGGVISFDPVPQAIRYAVDNGAKVINLSLSDFETAIPLVSFIQSPCADAYQRGALCVVSSGNDGGTKASGYPRDYPALIVTANDKSGAHAAFAQRADTQWSASAPGVAIYSTWPVENGSYATHNGTSMAAPHAAGVVALAYAALKPPPTGAGTQAVIDRVLTSATPMPDPTTNGAGRVNAAGAVGASVASPATTQAPTASTPSRTATTPRPSSGPSAPSRSVVPAPAPELTPLDPAAIAEDDPFDDPATDQVEDAAASAEAGSSSDTGRVALWGLAALLVLCTAGAAAVAARARSA